MQIYRAFANRTATGIRNPARTASAEHCPQKEDGRTHFSHGFAAKRGRLHLAAVYHRRPLTETGRDCRETCIDRLYFDKQGNIVPVKMTFEGVKKVKAPKTNKK